MKMIRTEKGEDEEKMNYKFLKVVNIIYLRCK